MRKGIIIGIGILGILLALAGTASAHPSYYSGGCNPFCHSSGFNGTFFNNTHKFNGISVPTTNAPNNNCAKCHSNPPSDMSMKSTGQNYSIKHNGMNTSGYIMSGVNCSYCHVDPAGLGNFSFLSNGTTFNQIHKFNGVAVPKNATSCTSCHIDVMTFLPLTARGTNYGIIHRYNAATLASEMLAAPACYNCHVDVNESNFTMLSGTPAYLTSATCKACHRAKYDNWTNTMHRVILTPNTTAAAMNLTVPDGLNWTTTNVSYMIVGKSWFYYLNETGYFYKRYDVVNQIVTTIPGYYNLNQYSCGSCHTTGYNASGGNQSGLLGIVGTWSEPGIACERCHGAGGNGHQVVVNYSGYLCTTCHNGYHGTGWELGTHAPPLTADNSSCSLLCHSPFDKYNNNTVTGNTAINVACAECHNPHNTTDDQYGTLLAPGGFNATIMANVQEVKLSYFNATASANSKATGSNASLTVGNDIFDILTSPILLFPGTDSRKDSSYGSAPINVTGPVSEVLCSMCHYEHGLGHIANANLTHGRNSTSNLSKWATCTDCHYAGAGGLAKHSLNAINTTDFPTKTCSRGTECHVTSAQNQSLSDLSLISVQAEWKATAHDDKETSLNHSNPNSSFYRSINGTTGAVTIKSRQNSCNKCHSPIDWNPATDSNTTNVLLPSDFKGITCTVCHNIHDMGDWIKNTGKVYGWYNRDAINNSGVYQASYTVMDNTTELCGNCHANVRIGREGPGWNGTGGNPTKPHGFPAKDVFVGSWKQSSLLNFECKDCHMYINKTNATGVMLNDTEKITGHSFAVNESGLQNTTACSRCHINGTSVDTIANVVATIQADTHAKWNATNITVQNALTAVKSYTGVNTSSRDKIAQAYWNLYLVSSDESWGVHDPVGTSKLLDDAAALANAANASLGQGLVSTVNLKAGWNLVALNGTPSVTSPISVMSSVASNITVVWGYNTSSAVKWELYDPLMPSGLNSLRNMVPGQGYWVYAKVDTVWTV